MTAYYNENDPHAALWLRNLIAAGHLPPGEVDERSIVDVQPSDLEGFVQCHFFAGIGGWPLALRLAGWSDDREVWTGSCPCQPLSDAGQRKGHVDERHLWPAFFNLIAERCPPTIFGEQVASADGREWFAGVRADLEAARYACGGADLPASSVGAPHRRQRIFWVANAAGGRRGEFGNASLARRGGHVDGGDASRGLADADGRDAGAGELQRSWEHGFEPTDSGAGASLVDTDSGDATQISACHEAVGEQRPALGRGAEQSAGPGTRSGTCGGDHPEGIARGSHGSDTRGVGDREPVADAGHTVGRGEQQAEGARRRGCESDGSRELGGPRTLADAQHDDGRTDEPRRGSEGREAGFWSAFDLVPCADGKARRVEPGTFPLAHGISSRMVKLRGYGNAIVPQVAAQFIRAFEEAHRLAPAA